MATIKSMHDVERLLALHQRILVAMMDDVARLNRIHDAVTERKCRICREPAVRGCLYCAACNKAVVGGK